MSTQTSKPTAKQAKEIYKQAYRLYGEGKYLEASYQFRLLTMTHPLEPAYWTALGASLQLTKNYQMAIEIYATAQLLNKEKNPYLYVQVADCLFALKQTEQALSALQQAENAAQVLHDTKILNHVALMRELWSNKNKG